MNTVKTIGLSLIALALIRTQDACGQIIISDGPGAGSAVAASGAKATPARSHIVTTDGPATLSYQYPPKIVTTDGPSHLAYQYPPKIVVTDGAPAYSAHKHAKKIENKVLVSDGPGTTRYLSASAKPDVETSTLAPMVKSVRPKKHADSSAATHS